MGENSTTGNIGALLRLVDAATSTTHVHLYDKNGNVSGFVNSTTRKKSATYDYDAFGQLTICHGPCAKENPFTFSTKYADFATGLCYYYGYKWYVKVEGSEKRKLLIRKHRHPGRRYPRLFQQPEGAVAGHEVIGTCSLEKKDPGTGVPGSPWLSKSEVRIHETPLLIEGVVELPELHHALVAELVVVAAHFHASRRRAVGSEAEPAAVGP